MRRVERAYRDGGAPLNAAEGYVRQVLGRREYVRGPYRLTVPGYKELNFPGAGRDIPDFYRTGETAMNRLREVVGQTSSSSPRRRCAGCRPNALPRSAATPRAVLDGPRPWRY